MELRVRNVNEALSASVRKVLDNLKELKTVAPRGAATIEWPEPVATVYDRPCERVLFNEVRDANPFFHFFEALWMLAGRNDIAFTSSLVKRMAAFSDDGVTQPAAYGHRWRSAFGFDQLQNVIGLLREDPSTRRAVLAMWSPSYDGDWDRLRSSKDLPCNTTIYFKVRERQLNMTVCCRSNDILWGAYGANAVHMSMLQEYVAGKIGMTVGRLYQLSDSWHIYTGGDGGKVWDRLVDAVRTWPAGALVYDPYTEKHVRPVAMGSQHPDWNDDLAMFFYRWDRCRAGTAAPPLPQPDEIEYGSPWFKHVVAPLWRAWRTRDREALSLCMADDWRVACDEWLARRERKA